MKGRERQRERTKYQKCICVNPNLPNLQTPQFLLGRHTFVLYICVSISALQIHY